MTASVAERPGSDPKTPAPHAARRLAIVVKGYPRLSETFIAQELLALQRRGFAFDIWSLRHPTDGALHPMHRAITQPRLYLPEYLYQEPLRVLRGLAWCLTRRGFPAALAIFLRDWVRDPTANRGRRFGQALVFARELDPAIGHVHVHYLHTPASVVRYAAIIRDFRWSVSAHAKDIWTTPDWEKREKLAEARWGVTCAGANLAELRRLAPDPETVTLVYHGLDLTRFPAPPARPPRDGRDPADPVRIVSVGRAVAKKGFEVLLRALARLPADVAWRFDHIGAGERLAALRALAAELGVTDRVTFHGARPQEAVIEALRAADLFALACQPGEKGDQDGLPNVVMEAATQALPIVTTRFAATPEFVSDGVEGLLVPHGDPVALEEALAALIADPARRSAMGAAALRRVRDGFSFEAGVDVIAAQLDRSLDEAGHAARRR